MEFLQPEDTMELASSPHMPQDDLDLDLDTMYEPELAPEDSMVEDAFDDDRLEVTDHFDDDEMVDGDTAVQHFPHGASDLNIETHHEHETALEDEDILYEDDEAAKDSGFVQSENDSVNINPEHNHLQEPLGLISGDVEVSEGHDEDEFAFVEQDTEEQSASTSKSRVAEAPESSYEQPVEDEYRESIQANDTFEVFEEANMETRANAEAYTSAIPESGLDLQEPTTNTNPKDPADAVPGTELAEQDTTEDANTIAIEAATEQHTYPLENQDVALHTVRVIYGESEICLFPPQSEEGAETFFLSEQSLAYETLDKLLASCRDVLADTIGDDDELVLDVASLGLHISEDSKYAAEITLSQILNVYLRLSHNDNIEQIEPLYCNLSSRVCLASQYAYLAGAAREGKTITEITAEHMDSPDIEGLEEPQEHEGEPIDHNAAHYEATETGLLAPELSELDYADHGEDGADAEANETIEGREEDHLDTTGQTDSLEAPSNEEQRGIADTDPQQETQRLDTSTAPTEGAGPDDEGIEPSNTEYQEDIDEVANEDHDDITQEPGPAAEQNVDTVSANDETTSSGTVEAEVRDHQEEHFEETFEQDDNHLQAFGDDGNQPDHDFKTNEARDEHIAQTSNSNSNSTDPKGNEEHEDDLLDLGPEDQEQPSTNQLDSTDKVDEAEFQDLEDNEDLFDEADASTDQTLDNTQGDEQDDLDAFLPPTTPTKTRSAKRKVEADDEDVFDLLDTETPDKKRTRPS